MIRSENVCDGAENAEMDKSPDRSGGPKTAEGKATSRCNAVRHGLRAEKLGLDGDDDEAFAALRTELVEEYDPQTPTEWLLLDDAWRHACFLHRAADAEGSCWRSSVGIMMENTETPDDVDAAMAAAGASPRLDLIARYRRTHERGLHQALSSLRNAVEEREQRTSVGVGAAGYAAADLDERVAALLNQFQTPSQCVNFLRERREEEGVTCAACGAEQLTWIGAPHHRWQCSACGRQMGVRAGTPMEGSHLPLTVWLKATVLLASDPSLSPRQLQRILGWRRYETIRALHATIRARLPDGLPPEEAFDQCVFGAGLNEASTEG